MLYEEDIVEYNRIPQTLLIATSAGAIQQVVQGDIVSLDYSITNATNDSNRYSLTTDVGIIYDPATYSVGESPSGGGPGEVV